MSRSDEIRNLIIGNAKKLMKEKSNITIRDIAKASFVNIAAVNYYFGDKDNLISIVINDAVNELKNKVYQAINEIAADNPIEAVMTSMIDIIYQFALENIGIVSYLFMNTSQNITTNVLLGEFLTDNEFTRMIINKLGDSSNTMDKETLYAKYMLIFSSFCIPLFVEIMQSINHDTPMPTLASLKNAKFRQIYIQELIKVINS